MQPVVVASSVSISFTDLYRANPFSVMTESAPNFRSLIQLVTLPPTLANLRTMIMLRWQDNENSYVACTYFFCAGCPFYNNNIVITFVSFVGWMIVLLLSVLCFKTAHSSNEISSLSSLEEYISSLSLPHTSIGTSVNSNPIYQIRLNKDIDQSKPKVAFICNIKGNELSTINICVSIIKDSLDESGKGFAELKKNYDLYVLPCVNPDGASKAFIDLNKGGANYNGIDLTKGFPDVRNSGSSDGLEPEVKAVVKFFDQMKFQLVGLIQTSRTGISYPLFSTLADNEMTIDHAIYSAISKALITKNTNLIGSGCDAGFTEGVARGDSLGNIVGTFEDYNYLQNDGLTFGLNLACGTGSTENGFMDNAELLKEFVMSSTRGLSGRSVLNHSF